MSLSQARNGTQPSSLVRWPRVSNDPGKMKMQSDKWSVLQALLSLPQSTLSSSSTINK